MKFIAWRVAPLLVAFVLVAGCLFASPIKVHADGFGQWYELYAPIDMDKWDAISMVESDSYGDYINFFTKCDLSPVINNLIGTFTGNLGYFFDSLVTGNFGSFIVSSDVDSTGLIIPNASYYPGLPDGLPTSGFALFSPDFAPKYICLVVTGSGDPYDAEHVAQFMDVFSTSYKPIDFNPFEGGSIADDGIYGSIYDLIGNAFYGSVDNITGYQDLVITVLATLACVIMFALPFLVLWFFLRLVGVL